MVVLVTTFFIITLLGGKIDRCCDVLGGKVDGVGTTLQAISRDLLRIYLLFPIPPLGEGPGNPGPGNPGPDNPGTDNPSRDRKIVLLTKLEKKTIDKEECEELRTILEGEMKEATEEKDTFRLLITMGAYISAGIALSELSKEGTSSQA